MYAENKCLFFVMVKDRSYILYYILSVTWTCLFLPGTLTCIFSIWLILSCCIARSGLALVERGVLRHMNGPFVYPEVDTDAGANGAAGTAGDAAAGVGAAATAATADAGADAGTPSSSSPLSTTPSPEQQQQQQQCKPLYTRADLGTGKGLVLLDICCGKGFFATVAAAIYPDAEIIMIDCTLV